MLENLDGVPNRADPFLWADFVELRALAHPDKACSRGDLVSVANRGPDLGNPKFDAWAKWQDLINFIETRRHRFGDHYPFTISSDRDTLQLNYVEGWSHRTYLTLLLAASLRHISKRRHHELTRSFEQTCFFVFKGLMPPGAAVRATGAGGGPEAPYRGTLFQKMQQVAADIRCHPNFNQDDFKPTDTGDGGIDLLAWHPMMDTRAGMPISFAQCGCSSEDWRFKQLEASPAMHGHHFPVMHEWSTFYFLPLDLRSSQGDWACKADIGRAIIVDRWRLIGLMQQFDLGTHAPDLPLVKQALTQSWM